MKIHKKQMKLSDAKKTKMFENEVECLNRLKKYEKHFPHIIHSYEDGDYGIIEMSYCGKRLRSKTILDSTINWNDQIDYIINALKSEHIIHLDIMTKNICMLDNMIYLIDYGIVAIDGNSKCRRMKTHHIDGDHYAYMERSLKRSLGLL